MNSKLYSKDFLINSQIVHHLMTSIWCYQFDLYSLWRNQKRIGELMKCFYRKSFFFNTYELSKDFNLNKNFYRNTIFHSGCQSFIYIWLEWSKNPKILEFSIIFLSIVYGWWKFFHKIFERNHSIITISFFKKKLFLKETISAVHFQDFSSGIPLYGHFCTFSLS